MKNESYYRIKEDLSRSGIRPGDELLIHSSFKSLGGVEGGIETLIEAIISYLGDRGTLLMPALSFATVNNPESNFTFDILNTPSCVGAVTEVFRKHGGALRSMHPTHSVAALGYRQREYTEGHYLDNTPVGEHSPFYLLSQRGGKVLMLGCGTGSNTSVHGIEQMARVPYVLSDEPREYTLIDAAGVARKKEYYYHYIGQRGFIQRYGRLENLMEYRKFKILAADCNLIDSAQMWRVGLKKLAEDAYYFVEKRQ